MQKTTVDQTRYYMAILNRYRHCLARQQYKTLKGQVLSGDYDGAMKGLAKLKERLRCVSTNS